MRRILFALTVAALMAAMMVSAGPAQANETSFGNSNNFVQVGNSLFGVGDIDDFDDNGIDFGHNFGHNGIIFGGIEQDSHSGDTAVCTGIEPSLPPMHASLLRRLPPQALVYSRWCGSTSLQTAVSE